MGRVHIVPTGFEFERIVAGLERFGVTRVYLIRGTGEVEERIEFFVRRLKDRYSYLVESGNFREVQLDIFDLAQVFGEVKEIIEAEGAENEVYINISTSSKLMVVALLMAAWCSDVSKMRAPPTIYYVMPEHYFLLNIPEIRERISKFKSRFKKGKVSSKEVLSLLDEVEEELRDFEGRGSSWGVLQVVLIPFMPIKPPSEFEMEILRQLDRLGGEAASIQALVESLPIEEHVRVGSRDPKRALRSKVNYYLNKLEERQLIEKIRWEGGVRVRLTDLGNVFARVQ